MNYQIQGLSIHAEVHGTAEPALKGRRNHHPEQSQRRATNGGYFVCQCLCGLSKGWTEAAAGTTKGRTPS